jgi:FkbM family methyltransferase
MTQRRHDSRWRRLRELAVSLALRASRRDFRTQKRLVAIVGDHIGDQIRARELYERDQLEFLRDYVLDLDHCRVQTALDVGANIGNHSLFFADLFAKVIAFEPNPLARSILDINLRLNEISNVEVRPVGLSDKRSQASITIPVENLGGARVFEGTHSTQSSDLVELVRGDEAIAIDTPIGLIKIDVEGAEAAALAGLHGTIVRHRPIIVLEQLSTAIDAATGESPSFSMLRELDYQAWELRVSGGRSRIAKALAPILLGRNPVKMVSLKALEARDYPALVFLPGSFEK